MTKAEFIYELSERSDVGLHEARVATNQVFAALKALLIEGRQVRVTGIGVFHSVRKKAVTQKNNLNGEIVDVPERMSLKFTPVESIEMIMTENLL